MNFIEHIRQKQLIVWGAGQESDEFFSQYDYYTNICRLVHIKLLPNIQRVWDSNSIKQGSLFHGCIVEAPNIDDFKKDETFCVIAIMNYMPVSQILDRANLKKDYDFKDCKSFFAACRYSMTYYAKEILLDLIKNNKLNVPCHEIYQIFDKGDLSLTLVSYIYSKIKESLLDNAQITVIQDIFLGFVLKKRIKNVWDKNVFIELLKCLPLSGITSALSVVLDKNTEDFYSFLEKNVLVDKHKKNIKTIGIHNKCYSNGGGARVLSLLMPIYLSLGYRIVFFTDEESDGEYFLPKEVTRIVLQNSSLSLMKLRLEEYLEYIKKYKIDIMCLHYLKFDITSFYEVLFFKLSRIPVLGEVHLMFLILINKQNYVAKQWMQTFRLLDRFIVLSHYNKTFWENMGCKTTYIPNPVENGKYLWNKPISFFKRKGKNILWIGRANDPLKRIKDVVDIIDEVRNSVNDVKLRIVGSIDVSLNIENTIKERGLEENIELCGYHKDVGSYYDEADIMLMTSEMEAFPMVLVESKLYGVPTVMYELPYLELVRDIRGILPVPQKNKHMAAEMLIKLLMNDSLRHKLSIDAKRSIYPFISYDIAGEWKQIFDEISHPCKKYTANVEQQMIQKMLLQEIWKED